jgi:hypothetical protein
VISGDLFKNGRSLKWVEAVPTRNSCMSAK